MYLLGPPQLIRANNGTIYVLSVRFAVLKFIIARWKTMGAAVGQLQSVGVALRTYITVPSKGSLLGLTAHPVDWTGNEPNGRSNKSKKICYLLFVSPIP